MGTRSLTFFYQYKEKTPFCCFYRQMDGYPTGHGKELADIITPLQLVNGYSFGEAGKTQANGVGCLAAQVVAALKEGVGSIYMHKPDLEQDAGQEYEYHIHAWQDDDSVLSWGHKNPFHTWIVVKDVYAKQNIFEGTFQQFGVWVLDPPMNDDGYIPVIGNITADPQDDEELTLRDSLRKGVVAVTFKKADNTTRRMRCTLNQDYIPEEKIPAGTSTSLRRDPHLFKVWDVQKKDWRSFREERVIDWSAE